MDELFAQIGGKESSAFSNLLGSCPDQNSEQRCWWWWRRRMAANQSAEFTNGEAQHYGDYGCDPQMDYFQKILEEAARKRSIGGGRSRDRDLQSTHHFKLQKPISKDAAGRKKKRSRGWWRWCWKGAAVAGGLRFWKWGGRSIRGAMEERATKPRAKSTPAYGAVAGGRSGPLYLTESCGGGSRTPCQRRTGGGSFRSSPLVAAEVGKVEVSYLSLTDAAGTAASPVPVRPAMPIYFVT